MTAIPPGTEAFILGAGKHATESVKARPVTAKEILNPVNVDSWGYFSLGGAQLYARANSDATRLLRVRVNGKTKTWKRDPLRLSLPLKHGMYECTRFDESDIQGHRLWVEVQ